MATDRRSTTGWGLRFLRGKALVIARLLVVAFALQLALPGIEGMAPVSLARPGTITADLTASLCHDASADHGGFPPAGDEHHGAGHCLFCLPLIGAHAVPGSDIAVIPLPPSRRIAVLAAPDIPGRPTQRHILASSRAPPSGPRIV